MKFKIQLGSRRGGFALVVTLSLMILLTVIAVGLLTLSTISLRSSTSGDAQARAFANARLAVMMAIGELQKHAGDDRRITSDASILSPDGQGQGQLVGVWDSWSPGLNAKPDGGAPDYGAKKTGNFRSWLVSAPDPKVLINRDWAKTAADVKWPRLFSLAKDGFDLSAAPVPILRGGLAWVVTQENTKAKINVAGPETDTAFNLALQAQRRPSLALASNLKQPSDGWNLRAGRVISLNQVKLDTAMVANPSTIATAGANYTVDAQGLLTDVVKGGFKTDLNLGFELEDADFKKDSWNSVKNPFRSAGSTSGFVLPNIYQGQGALFRPLVDNPIISNTTDYNPIYVADRFFAAAVPTFDHLRSFYRIPHHLYGGTPPTVAERGADHVAVRIPTPTANAYFAPTNPPQGLSSTLSIRPVLNRMIYLFSATLDSQNKVQLVLTPVISLWNPYNAALEIEGAVAYPWMDLPFQLDWEFKLASGSTGKPSVNMSEAMGKQFESKGHGRSIDPFFLCEMTANGDGDVSKPIRFEPGEIRIFMPASATPTKFLRKGTAAQRTVRLRAVTGSSQFNTKGGLLVPMDDVVSNHGFSYVVKTTDKISLKVREALTGTYNYFVSLEDASRIRNPTDATRGEAITEVQTFKFSSAVNTIASPIWSYSDLKTTPQPFGVIETFHRTALQSVGGQPISDLIYTTNPRHASINHQLAAGGFTAAPHFQSTLRSVSSFDGAIQTTVDDANVLSFWGAAHAPPSGRGTLPFFEIPREPLLSLAAFQHADLASSTFSSANQFANSWASPYLTRNKVAELVNNGTKNGPAGVPVYDTPYLTNEALWDGFFFSGAAPVLKPSNNGKPSTAWKSSIASVVRSVDDVVRDFIGNPLGKPLANSRMRLVKRGLADKDLEARLLEPAGCTRIASHLTVDGAFNVNSTNVDSWIAMLSGLRDEKFSVEKGSSSGAGQSPFPRFRHPSGTSDDNWNGFRTLNDGQIRTLAQNLVNEIRARGPFLSLAEFVNRRVEDSDLGRSGAIQTAIDAGKLNDQAKQAPFSNVNYPAQAKNHIITDTGVAIPGYLTQADVLQSLAPVITCRSDTFKIRGYGEAKDATGKVLARSWCEAVVQRIPDFVDSTNTADTSVSTITSVNQIFGRRFEIVSFRRLPSSEIQ